MLTHDNRDADARGALNIQPCYVSKLKHDDDELDELSVIQKCSGVIG